MVFLFSFPFLNVVVAVVAAFDISEKTGSF